MAVPETTGVKNAGGITRFMRETKVELKKVTWPTKQELIANTAVVLIAQTGQLDKAAATLLKAVVFRLILQ